MCTGSGAIAVTDPIMKKVLYTSNPVLLRVLGKNNYGFWKENSVPRLRSSCSFSEIYNFGHFVIYAIEWVVCLLSNWIVVTDFTIMVAVRLIRYLAS